MNNVEISVKTSDLIPRGRIRGGGGEGWAEVQCHPLDVEVAVATAKRMAKSEAQDELKDGETLQFTVSHEEVAQALDGVQVGNE